MIVYTCTHTPPNAKRLLLSCFLTQTPQRLQRHINGVLQIFNLEATIGLSDWVETEHISPIKISLRPEGPWTFPKTSLIKGNCQIKLYEYLCCGLTIYSNQLKNATSLAFLGIQRKRESSAKGQHCCSDWVTFWMTLLSDSCLSVPGNSHAHPPKK